MKSHMARGDMRSSVGGMVSETLGFGRAPPARLCLRVVFRPFGVAVFRAWVAPVVRAWYGARLFLGREALGEDIGGGGGGRKAGGDLSTSPLWAAHLTGWPRKPNVRFKDLPNPWKTPTRSSTSTRGARLSSRGQAARGGGVGRQDDRSAQRPAALKRGGTRKKKQPTRTTRLRPESKHGEVGRGLDSIVNLSCGASRTCIEFETAARI